MFIGPAYTRGPRPFLLVFANALAPLLPNGRKPLRCLVRRVTLRQLGQFMMGSTTIQGHRFSLSGAYGNNGLPMYVTVYERRGLPPRSVEMETHEECTAYYEAVSRIPFQDHEIVPGLWDRLHPMPDDLVEAFWSSDSHNDAGPEGPALRAWAEQNLSLLSHLRPAPPATPAQGVMNEHDKRAREVLEASKVLEASEALIADIASALREAEQRGRDAERERCVRACGATRGAYANPSWPAAVDACIGTIQSRGDFGAWASPPAQVGGTAEHDLAPTAPTPGDVFLHAIDGSVARIARIDGPEHCRVTVLETPSRWRQLGRFHAADLAVYGWRPALASAASPAQADEASGDDDVIEFPPLVRRPARIARHITPSPTINIDDDDDPERP